MSRRLAWVLAALTFVLALARTVLLVLSGRLWTSEALTAGFPLIDLGAVGGAIVGALILSRQPRHPIGWLFVLGQLATQFGVTAHAYGVAALRGDLPGAPGGAAAISAGLQFGAFPTLALLALLFLLAPDGRWTEGRWAWGVWVTGLGAVLHAAGVSQVRTDRLDEAGQVAASGNGVAQGLLLAAYALIAVGVLAGATALLSRLRRSHGPQREQLMWITLAAVLLASAAVFTLVAVEWLDLPAWLSVLPLMAAYACVPVLTGVGILRHHLFGVDVALNRAIVLTLLSGTATALYVGVVVLVSLPAPASMRDLGLLGSMALTAFVAVLLQPVRGWTTRFAARLVYGAQARPYESLADFTRELQDLPHPRRMLTAVAEAVGRAVGAVVVEVEVSTSQPLDSAPTSVSWERPGGVHSGSGADWSAPLLADAGRVVGRLAVRMPPGRGLRDLERQLLVDFSTQIGHVISNLRLGAELSRRAVELADTTEELEASRRRLHAAQNRERAQFEAAIRHVVLPHLDRLPEHLARLAAQVGVEPSLRVGLLIDGLIRETDQAVEALRTVTRGVFPAQLARRGVAAALLSHLAETHPGVQPDVDHWWTGRRLEPKLESTLYFAAVELLTRITDVEAMVLTATGDRRAARLQVHSRSGTTVRGLQGVMDRLAAFDGRLHSTRSPGSGRVYTLELPVERLSSLLETEPGLAQRVTVE
ncbi:hypothetical protein ACXR8F_10070 [Terrabacter sp. AAH1]